MLVTAVQNEPALPQNLLACRKAVPLGVFWIGSEVKTTIKVMVRTGLDFQSLTSMLFDVKSPPRGWVITLPLPSLPRIPTVIDHRWHRDGVSMLAGSSPASYHYETTVGGALPVISTLQVRADLTGRHHGFVWHCLCLFC